MTHYNRLSLFDTMLVPTLLRNWNNGNNRPEKNLEMAFQGYGLSEDENSVYMEIAMPGVKPEAIQLTYDKGVLSIQAENKTRKEGRKYHQEAQYNYAMKLSLPSEVDDAQEPMASYEAGILHLQLSKKKKYEPKKIAVRSS